jgi:hypothetical protein
MSAIGYVSILAPILGASRVLTTAVAESGASGGVRSEIQRSPPSDAQLQDRHQLS